MLDISIWQRLLNLFPYFLYILIFECLKIWFEVLNSICMLPFLGRICCRYCIFKIVFLWKLLWWDLFLSIFWFLCFILLFFYWWIQLWLTFLIIKVICLLFTIILNIILFLLLFLIIAFNHLWTTRVNLLITGDLFSLIMIFVLYIINQCFCIKLIKLFWCKS